MGGSQNSTAKTVCLVTPLLYNEYIRRELEGQLGTVIGRYSVKNLC